MKTIMCLLTRLLLVTVLLAGISFAQKTQQSPRKVVCYYNTKSHLREGQGKFEISHIEPALSYCTHLIYGYAAINDQNFKLTPLNEHFDTVQDNYRHVTDLKRYYPNLKVLLSVGGNEDISGEDEDRNLKYRTLIESSSQRLTFINSAHTLIKGFGFDGLDLAWEFPETKPKKIRSTLGNLWKKFKTKVAGESVIDEKAEEHKEQFAALVKEIKNVFKPDNLMLTLSVLPNVNSTVYYDPRVLSPHLDFVNLLAYDFYKPERNPEEADYPSPLYEVIDRKYDENADYQVKYWLNNGAPSNKIILGIPAYGRSWHMTTDSSIDAIPPLTVDGPGTAGPYTKDAGLLSYPEMCQLLHNPQNANAKPGVQFKIVLDPTHRKGNYFYRLPNEDGEGGIWVGYEGIEGVSNKASYARSKNLGGVAFDDLSMDDFRGGCSRDKYPLLMAIKAQL